MTLLWSVTGAVNSMEYFLRIWNEEPPRFQIVNEGAIHGHKLRIHGEYGGHADTFGGDATGCPLETATGPAPQLPGHDVTATCVVVVSATRPPRSRSSRARRPLRGADGPASWRPAR